MRTRMNLWTVSLRSLDALVDLVRISRLDINRRVNESVASLEKRVKSRNYVGAGLVFPASRGVLPLRDEGLERPHEDFVGDFAEQKLIDVHGG